MSASAQVPGRYQLLRPLGAGGMGEVWLARDNGVDPPSRVALKRLHPGLARDPVLIRQFEREARIGEALRHPNVVAVLQSGEDAQGPFLVLEYVDGPTASALLVAMQARQEQLPLPAALSIARDVTRALFHAHSVRMEGEARGGIVHRDLSPDNILIDRSGVTKLADFGIARGLDSTSLTRTGTVKGKFGFLAPELLEGVAADLRSDVFSLAATLFTLLCGVRPFQGRTEAEQVRSLLHSEPPRLADLRPDVPEEIAEWIQRALGKVPGERPQSTEGLLAALDRVLPAEAEARSAVAACVAGLAPEVGEAPPTQQMAPRSVSGRWRWAVAVALLGSMGLAGALVLNRHAVKKSVDGASGVESGRAVAQVSAPAVVPMPVPAGLTPVSAPKPPRAPEPRVAPPPRKSPTTLWVKVSPWGQVFLDGRLLGMTPLTPQTLNPGRHSVIIVNQDLQVRRQRDVTLRAGENRVLRLDLGKR